MHRRERGNGRSCENETCRLLRAARKRYSMWAGGAVNTPRGWVSSTESGPSCGTRKVNSVGLRCGAKHALQCRDAGTCGRIGADSCARVPPYCSFWAVGYDISCGGSDPKSPFCTAYTFGRGFRARRGLRDSDRRDFLRRMTSPALPPIGRRDAKERIR